MTEQNNPYLLTPEEICLHSGCAISSKDLEIECPYKEKRACSYYQAATLASKELYAKMVRMGWRPPERK